MAIKRLDIKGLPNIRDLGGYKTTDGKSIKYGALYRSGKLYKLNKKSKLLIEELKLSNIIDLRIDTERLEKPDTLINGTKNLSIPLLCTATPAITQDKSMRITLKKESKRIKKEFKTADNYMVEMYKNVLTNNQTKNSLIEILNVILNSNGVLWHCNGGKDRAGIVAMLVLGLLGVDEKTIISDYEISHTYQKKKLFWAKLGLSITFLKREFKDIIINMLSAKKEYITKTLEFINDNYGSVENYAKKELLSTDEFIKKLKDKYLE